MSDTDLHTRAGLPEALRVLLKDYPREAWEADPAFSDLIRFWLERHMMFRRLMDILGSEAEAALDGKMEPTVFGAHLARYGRLLTQELHAHHSIEDHHYFPRMKDLDARIASGFDVLDRDHHAIDSHLADFVEAANAVLQAIGEGEAHRDPLGAHRDGLIRLKGFLHRHLEDEEELVVPVLLKYAPSGLV